MVKHTIRIVSTIVEGGVKSASCFGPGAKVYTERQGHLPICIISRLRLACFILYISTG